MKKYFSIIANLLIFNCGMSINAQVQQFSDTNAQIFKNPKDATKLHVWWHWVEGGITKPGITKDLEAMKQNGIVQATILNIGLFEGKDFGVKKIVFNTPEWHEMFLWALKEANRLKIKIGAHNCDGWSSSGGPWISPEQSMKVFTWSKILTNGNKKLEISLPKPFHTQNFYQDVAIVAVDDQAPISSFQKANPIFTKNDTSKIVGLADGCSTAGPVLKFDDKIIIQFNKPFKTNKIAIFAQKPFSWSDPNNVKHSYNLYYSNDNVNYVKHTTITLPGINKMFEFNFAPVSAKYFKLEFDQFPWSDAWFPYTVSEVELLYNDDKPLYQNSIPFINQKTTNSKADNMLPFQTLASGTIPTIQEKNVIDISKYMDKNGVLKWNAPKGNWKIIRFGYTATAAKNSPATKEGEGLECDKMDSNVVKYHFSKFSQKLINTAGNYTGNTFKFLLIDSWECGFQNWTANIPQEFEKRRGYKLIPFIPVLCGDIIGNSAMSEAFLYDFRKTHAELIEQNYYQQFSKLCHKNKLEMHAEVIYGSGLYPALDVLKTNQYSEMPMFEFWTGSNGKTGFVEYNPKKIKSIDFPASAALFYEKPIVGAEAYTSMANYSESPWDLKPYGDRAYCTGINQLILHSNVHQPNDSMPGMTLGDFGSHFNRHIPWFKYASSWIDYHARIQQMLQKGQMHADILYYVGDQLPQNLEPTKNNVPPLGYQTHVCNFDILKNKLKVVNGKLIWGNVKFSILTLPENMGMNLETLLLLKSLVNEGIILFGARPTHLLSYNSINKDANQFNVLVKELWGNIDGKNNTSNNFGKGKVYFGKPFTEILEQEKILPDFTIAQSDSSNLLFTHRIEVDKDIYFVFNQSDDSLSRNFNFKSTKKSVRIFNPLNGDITLITNQTNNGNQTMFDYKLGPKESKIILFDNIDYPKTKHAVFTKVEIKNLKGVIDFDNKITPKITPKSINSLVSLTSFLENDIKYFSGFANYTLTFDVNSKLDTKRKQIKLNIGKFGGTASVTLNGYNLGNVWSPNSSVDITNKLKTNNILLVSVGNEYRNRIIGDLIEYGTLKNVWTSLNTTSQLNKNQPLKPSGLIGDIKIEISK